MKVERIYKDSINLDVIWFVLLLYYLLLLYFLIVSIPTRAARFEKIANCDYLD